MTLRRVDPSGYPTIRATLVAPVASDQAPTLTENGLRVVDLTALNLSASKSVVIAVDRSRSMAGKQLDDAAAAARKFLASKAGSDRVAVVVFGSKAVQLTPFASSTIDADDALRTMAVDSKAGTALNDAVVLSAALLSKEQGRARVVVLLTDGQDVSSKASLAEAVASAHKAGALVYPDLDRRQRQDQAAAAEARQRDRRRLQLGRLEQGPRRRSTPRSQRSSSGRGGSST